MLFIGQTHPEVNPLVRLMHITFPGHRGEMQNGEEWIWRGDNRDNQHRHYNIYDAGLASLRFLTGFGELTDNF